MLPDWEVIFQHFRAAIPASYVVPQGSGPGPILINLYLHISLAARRAVKLILMLIVVSCNKLSYSQRGLFIVVHTVDQTDFNLKSISEWSESNGLVPNLSLSKVIII